VNNYMRVIATIGAVVVLILGSRSGSRADEKIDTNKLEHAKAALRMKRAVAETEAIQAHSTAALQRAHTNLARAMSMAVNPETAKLNGLDDPQTARYAELLERRGPATPYKYFIETGARFQSPYTVSYDATTDTAKLTKAGSTTAGYLEFSFYNRWALRLPDDIEEARTPLLDDLRDHGSKTPRSGKDPTTGLGEVQWMWPFLHMPDFELHMGYVFGSGTSTTNLSASSIAGGSDFYTGAAMGLPILRLGSSKLMQQVTLEAEGGATTDKDFLAVHPNLFFGPGYQMSFRAQGNTNAAFFLGRVGFSLADMPRFKTGSDLSVVTSRTLPQYTLKGGAAMGASIHYPIGNIYAHLAGNMQFRGNPAPWNISVGFTIPFAEIGKLLGAKND
jgi:hypothetical protein